MRGINEQSDMGSNNGHDAKVASNSKCPRCGSTENFKVWRDGHLCLECRKGTGKSEPTVKMPFTKHETYITKDGEIVQTYSTDPIPLNKWVSAGQESEPVDSKCGVCDGTGVIKWTGHKGSGECMFCAGTGKVTESKQYPSSMEARVDELHSLVSTYNSATGRSLREIVADRLTYLTELSPESKPDNTKEPVSQTWVQHAPKQILPPVFPGFASRWICKRYGHFPHPRLSAACARCGINLERINE